MAVSPEQHAAHTSGLKAMVNSFIHPQPKIRISNTKVTTTIGKPAPLSVAIKNRNPFKAGPISNGIGVGP